MDGPPGAVTGVLTLLLTELGLASLLAGLAFSLLFRLSESADAELSASDAISASEAGLAGGGERMGEDGGSSISSSL